jgi:chromosome segregation ATPase
VEDLTKQLSESSATNAANSARLVVAQETIANLTKSNENLQTDIKGLDKKLNAKDMELLSSRNALEKSESEVKAFSVDIGLWKEKLAQSSSVNEELKARLTDVTSRLTASAAEFTAQSKLVDELKASVAREIASTDIKLADMKSALDAALVSLKAEKAANDLLAEKLKSLTGEGGTLELEAKLRASNDGLKLQAAELTLATGKVNQYTEKLNALAAELSKKDKLLAEKESEFDDLVKQVEAELPFTNKLKADLKTSVETRDSLQSGIIV